MKSKRVRWYQAAYWGGMIAGLGLTLTVLPGIARAQCAGACSGNGTVNVTGIITLVNIILGNQDASTCPNGIPNPPANVTTVIQAVNIVLNDNGMCPTPTAVCGDGKVEPPEECDNGGTCIGGSNAGTACTSESDCQGNGVCIGGPKDSYSCAQNSDCDSSAGAGDGVCKHCVVQGGTGCAANCTVEQDVVFDLDATKSAAQVHGDALTIPLPLSGTQTFTIGKKVNDQIPVIIKADSVKFPQIDVMGLACACVRGVAAKTCGGTVFLADGTPAQDCTPGFSNNGDTTQDGPCPADLPCTFVHGPGNSAHGIIGCNGLQGIDLTFTQDGIAEATLCTTDSDCSQFGSTCNTDLGSCNPAPATLSLSGSGGPGSAIMVNSTAIGQIVGACVPDFCTDSDPYSDRGTIATLPLTTGTAAGMFTHANGTTDDSDTICDCPMGFPSCSLSDCLGPLTVQGAALDCTAIENGVASGGSLAGAFTSPAVPIVGDSVVTNAFFAQ